MQYVFKLTVWQKHTLRDCHNWIIFMGLKAFGFLDKFDVTESKMELHLGSSEEQLVQPWYLFVWILSHHTAAVM